MQKGLTCPCLRRQLYARGSAAGDRLVTVNLSAFFWTAKNSNVYVATLKFNR
jgi:hypothetical protein